MSCFDSCTLVRIAIVLFKWLHWTSNGLIAPKSFEAWASVRSSEEIGCDGERSFLSKIFLRASARETSRRLLICIPRDRKTTQHETVNDTTWREGLWQFSECVRSVRRDRVRPKLFAGTFNTVETVVPFVYKLHDNVVMVIYYIQR